MKKFVHVGTSGWGMFWLREFIPGQSDVAECVAAVDINPVHLKNAAELLKLPENKCYTDLDKALSENKVDFVTIASSIPSHEDVVDIVLKYGLDILSEKPIAHSMESCSSIYRKVKNAGIKFGVTMNHRHERDKLTLGKILRDEIYGKTNFIVSRVHMAMPKRRSGVERRERAIEYILIDGGIHNIDMIRSFTGSEPKKVYADIWDFEPGGDWYSFKVANVHYEMENGVRALMEYTLGSAYTLNGWGNEYFRAECANAIVELDNKSLTAKSLGGYPAPRLSELPLLNGEYWEHHLLIRRFVEWLDGGEEYPVIIDDSIKSMGMMFAAVESFKTGQPVMAQDFYKKYV